MNLLIVKIRMHSTDTREVTACISCLGDNLKQVRFSLVYAKFGFWNQRERGLYTFSASFLKDNLSWISCLTSSSFCYYIYIKKGLSELFVKFKQNKKCKLFSTLPG